MMHAYFSVGIPLVLLVVAPPAGAVQPLTFMRSGGGVTSINYTANLGSSETVIDPNNGASGPALSPDGQVVAFHTSYSFPQASPNYGIYVERKDGTGLQQVLAQTNDASYTGVDWDPNGTRLVFSLLSQSAGQDALYTINVDGSGLTALTGFGDYSGPHFSADGTRLLYTSGLNGPSPHIIMASSSGGTLADLGPGNYADFSPDGQKAVISSSDGHDLELYVQPTSGGTRQQLTNNTVDDLEPSWAADNSVIAYYSTNYTIRTVNPTGGGDTQILGIQGSLIPDSPSFRQPSTVISYVDPDELLRRYAPQVRYDSQEGYFADAAAMATDNYIAGKKGYSNKLKDRATSPRTYATADPGLGFPRLTLSFLGTNYSGAFPLDSDYIEYANTYQTDANRMDAQLAYKNVIYGHAVENTVTHQYWLQYWMYMYYDYVPLGSGQGSHEGDWEMVQYRIPSAGGPPDCATYARHDSESQTVPYYQVEQALAGDGTTHPVVYTARGTHASYFDRGSSNQHVRPGLPNDITDGAGRQVIPTLSPIDENTPWVKWPGHWGDTVPNLPGGVGGTSPAGPKFHGQWSDPQQFADGAGSCGGTARARRAGGGVSAPKHSGAERHGAARVIAPPVILSARRRGARVLIRYRTRIDKPYSITLTVHTSGYGFGPQLRRLKARTNGVALVSVSIPHFGRPPYRVMASTSDRDGTTSAVTSRRVT